MKSLISSFKFAFSGIKYLIKSQQNFRIHLVFAFLAIILAILLKFTLIEFAIIFVVIGVVLFGEAINTAIERTVDCAAQDVNECAKMAKDTAAAAVLILAIAAVCVGCALYLSKIIALLRG